MELMKLGRSNTVRGLNTDGTLKKGAEGQSRNNIVMDEYKQRTLIPRGLTEEESVRSSMAVDEMHDNWVREKNTTLNGARTLSEYSASKAGDNMVNLLNKRGGKHRRRPSRKYKKSAKRVFRKKSRSTRRR